MWGSQRKSLYIFLDSVFKDVFNSFCFLGFMKHLLSKEVLILSKVNQMAQSLRDFPQSNICWRSKYTRQETQGRAGIIFCTAQD